MDPRNCGYCKNCAVGNYDACTSFQPSASAEPDQSKCTVCRNSAGVGMTVCDACHASMGMATRALGASQTERIAGMLDGYVESIKEHGGTMLERWHYIPEIEDAAESLRAALQPSFPPPVTAAREQEASATGAEPVAMKSIAYPNADLSCGLSTGGILICGDEKSINRVRNALHAESGTVPALRAELIEARKAALATPATSTTGKDLTDGAVFHLASRIANLINRHDGKADTLMPELRSLVLAVTGKVDASRVRDEALEEAAQLYGEGEVAAPGGHSQWGDAHQEGWIDGTKAYRDAIRSLIGTPKSAEGEGDG